MRNEGFCVSSPIILEVIALSDEKIGSDERIMAGLCYIPFMLINVFASLYILIGKKGGKYARYHALQGISVAVALFLVGMAFWSVYALPMMQKQLEIQSKILGMQGQGKNATSAASQEFLRAYSDIMASMLPFMFFGLLVLGCELGMAIFVGLGRDLRIPVLGGFLMRFL